MNKWTEVVMHNGIWEHYNPDTGMGYGAEGLGMSCLIVDWFVRLGIVDIPTHIQKIPIVFIDRI
jgi:hypothetical protein